MLPSSPAIMVATAALTRLAVLALGWAWRRGSLRDLAGRSGSTAPGGAALDALFGFTRRRRPGRRRARAAEASGAIVLAVAARGAGQARALGALLAGRGGRPVRVEAAPR